MKNKVFSMLMSLAIALGLWLYVITVVSPGAEYTYTNIPVVFEGETAMKERGLMLTSGEEASVNLRLSGNRIDLNKLSSSNIVVKVNLARVYDPGDLKLDYTISFPGNVSGGAITVESRSPSYVSMSVDRISTKNVPVLINYTGSVPEGFISDPEGAILDYPDVTVQGPGQVIDLIDHATIDVELNGHNESISESYRYTLRDATGEPVNVEQVTTNVAEVHLDLKIQRVQELKLTIDVNYGGGATAENSTIEIIPSSIRVSGSEALLGELQELKLGSVNLSEITEDTGLTFPITLPEGVTNLTGVTEAAVNITFQGLSIQEYTVENLKAINVPENMECDLMAEVIKVTLRGPSSVMLALKPENITITVDCTGRELGSSTMKATVSFSSDTYSNVGVIGTCSVPVTLREKGK